MDVITRPHAVNLVRFAATRPELLVLSADLTSSCEADDFQRAYPDRFLSFGMAEQNMTGFAAGLAREGFVPYIHTFAVFICRRPFDQVAMSVAYPNLKVRFIGFLPGITTPGGVTHQAIDDVALMRAIPNMTVIDCGDATEVESVLDAIHDVDGPVYVRMLRGEVPRLFDKAAPLALGMNRVLSRGTDVVVVSSGICTEEALRARQALATQGVSVAHVHVSTLKPFHAADILELAAGCRYGVVTIENHSVIGGLGSGVAEAIAEAGIGRRLVRLGLQDVYAHGASKGYLMREYGIDAAALVSAIEDLAGRRFGIGPERLAEVALPPPGDHAKAEAL